MKDILLLVMFSLSTIFSVKAQMPKGYISETSINKELTLVRSVGGSGKYIAIENKNDPRYEDLAPKNISGAVWYYASLENAQIEGDWNHIVTHAFKDVLTEAEIRKLGESMTVAFFANQTGKVIRLHLSLRNIVSFWEIPPEKIAAVYTYLRQNTRFIIKQTEYPYSGCAAGLYIEDIINGTVSTTFR